MNIRKLAISFLATLSLLFATVLPAFAVNTTTVVTAPSLATNISDVIAHPEKWFFYNDETDVIDNALGSFVNGPVVAPLGTGSAQISVTGSQRRNLATYQFSGTPLANITTLTFSTYNPSSGNGAAASANRSGYLNFNVDFNNVAYYPVDSWQKRLVYVPAANTVGTIPQNTWKEWDGVNGGNGLWTWSGYASNGNKWPDNNTSEYRTWSSLLTAFPGIRVRVTDSWMGIRVGEPYADGYTENIDAFKLGTASGTKTFDFEPNVAPSTPVITIPTNGVSVLSSALVKVDWTDSSGSTNPPYEYQYEAFSDALYTSNIYSSGWLTVSEIPTAGTPPGEYYLRVRARDGALVTSAWTNGVENPYHITVVPVIGPPTTVDQCKNGGWSTFNSPTFPNQGQCVAYVRANSHSILGNATYSANGLTRTAQFVANTADQNGAFTYKDANGSWYRLLISSVSVSGQYAYFAGKVAQASNPSWVGQWLFAKVKDGSPDQIWGSFTTKTLAEAGVSAMTSPADGPFNVVNGVVFVH